MSKRGDRPVDPAFDSLLSEPGPNKPERLAAQGAHGETAIVSPEEQRQRRIILDRLMQSTLSGELIERKMAHDFGMTASAVANLKRKVYASWQEEDAETKPHRKAMAIRRLRTEILEARKDGSHTAVGMMEKILAAIEGTNEPIEVRTSAEVRVTASVMHVLNEFEPTKLRELMAKEEARLAERGEYLLEDDGTPAEDEITVTPVPSSDEHPGPEF